MNNKFIAQIGNSINNEVLVDGSVILSYKNRSPIYLWVVVCTDAGCNGDWDQRLNWNQYTGHYNTEHRNSWGGTKPARACDVIMDHIKVVSRWKEDGVETASLEYIENVENNDDDNDDDSEDDDDDDDESEDDEDNNRIVNDVMDVMM